MAGQSYIGMTIYVADETPATNDAAGFAALDWTEVGGMVGGPQLGFTHNMIEIPDLKTGRGTAVKGMATGQDSSMSFRIDDGALEAGQSILKAIADSPQGHASVKLGRGTGPGLTLIEGDPVQYAQGLLHSFSRNPADDSSYEGFSVSFRLNAEPVDALEPAP